MAESQRSGLFVFRGNEDDIVLAFVGTDSWLAIFGVVGERCVLKRCDGDVGLSVISNLVSDFTEPIRKRFGRGLHPSRYAKAKLDTQNGSKRRYCGR